MVKFLKLGEGTPVVIDVLRASSTIITALANGITEVIPVNSVQEAFKLKKEDCIIAGERDGVKIKGFDIGNSPVELLEILKNKSAKKLVLKTTNATKILCSLKEAYIVSTLNLELAKEKFQGRKVSLIIVGSKHGIEEDLAVGLALYSSLKGLLEIDPKWVKENVLHSKAAEHLRKIGYGKDVEFIVNKRYHVLPKLEKGIIKTR